MLYVRRQEDLCVLQVSTGVLMQPGTVITDQNAASNYVRFYAPSQWQLLDFDDIFARDWTHPDDQIREWRHKSRKCAEILVPNKVSPSMITGAIVADSTARSRLIKAGFRLATVVNPDLFFR